MLYTVASTVRLASKARATVRSAFTVTPRATVVVLDLDGSYRPVGAESVTTPAALGLDPRELHVRTVLLDEDDLVRWVQPLLVRQALRSQPTVLAVRAGVLFLRDPTELAALAGAETACVLARCTEPLPEDGLWPGPADQLAAGSYSSSLVAVSRAAGPFLDAWETLAADPRTASDRWIDLAASSVPHHALASAHWMVSGWTSPRAALDETRGDTLEVDGVPAVAVDLTGLDVSHPWVLDAEVTRPPRIRLSDHPVLAALAARCAADGREGGHRSLPVDARATSLPGVLVHDLLRAVYRAELDSRSGRTIESLPDPFDPDRSDAFRRWLVEPGADGRDLGLGRYLATAYRSRVDLRWRFPGVPGAHAEALLEWADKHGRHEDAYSSALIDATLEAIRRTTDDAPARAPRRPLPGVNVVGYLRAELGVGESARLMLDALAAGDVPHATASVDRHVQSRQGATFPASTAAAPFDTTLLCVNADMTAAVSATVPALLARSYRIGMWYWEVEDFPEPQRDAFHYVDEVWVATDFIRRAIAPHSPVPVRTITPPLPRPRASGRSRTEIGLPDRPYLLFSFDYLSTPERKNPWGLVDAFEAAFAPGEGPLLVIKSINADRRPRDAERLRLRAAGLPDVLLLEGYLDAEDRDALVAGCDGYVSLHRSEGLGLTMAEAMALGKPVVATAYGGNLQFMTDANSFLVPWAPVAIPEGCAPYPAGGTWAEPDTAAAAALIRAVHLDPELAAARGRRAAEDLRTLHSPEVAARQIAARLDELAPARRARRRAANAERWIATARRALRR